MEKKFTKPQITLLASALNDFEIMILGQLGVSPWQLNSRFDISRDDNGDMHVRFSSMLRGYDANDISKYHDLGETLVYEFTIDKDGVGKTADLKIVRGAESISEKWKVSNQRQGCAQLSKTLDEVASI